MNTELENTKAPIAEKPQIFLKSITFNDNTKLLLERNSIIVFTGPNNSGKSRVLKDIEYCLDKSNEAQTIIIKEADFEYFGVISEESFLNERLFRNEQGNYHFPDSGATFNKSTLQALWENKTLRNGLHLLFVKLLSTEFRLTASNPLNRHDDAKKHPIFKLYNNETLTRKLSSYFRQAFGTDLVVHRNELQTIPLHTGQAPDGKSYTMDRQDDYYDQVNKLPRLHNQGDGMRSFASVLLDTFTSEHTITLIDEPEAFLHPPQARLLGKMLTKHNPDKRQLFISTHSENLLKGLLDTDNKNVTVIRIDRENNINRMSILENNEIKRLWSNPILRYSNILSGLFHEKVIVCESDYDCLFYQAIMDAIYENKNETAPHVLFTHCGGLSRIKDVVIALKAINIPVIAICDFDLIRISTKIKFKSIVSAFKVDWDSKLSKNMDEIYKWMNADGNAEKQTEIEKNIKENGKSEFKESVSTAYDEIEKICKAIGLFLVPVGEMECFYKIEGKKKKEWVYHILEGTNLAQDTNLESARKFVQEIINHKPFSEK